MQMCTQFHFFNKMLLIAWETLCIVYVNMICSLIVQELLNACNNSTTLYKVIIYCQYLELSVQLVSYLTNSVNLEQSCKEFTSHAHENKKRRQSVISGQRILHAMAERNEYKSQHKELQVIYPFTHQIAIFFKSAKITMCINQKAQRESC